VTAPSLSALIGPAEVLDSSTLIQRCSDSGIDPVYARQLARRIAGRNGLWRSERLALQHNGRLFAHSAFVGTGEFLAQAMPILARERPGLHRLIRKLIATEVVLAPQARLTLASPASTQKCRYPSYEEEIAALTELRVAEIESGGTVEERLVLSKIAGTPNSAAARLRAQTGLMIQGALTKILYEYFRRQNFISWNAVVGDEASQSIITFNNYSFHAATFSWLSVLLRWQEGGGKPRPTPVVFHACDEQCGIWDVEGFMSRIQRAGSNKTSKLKIQGVLAAPDFDTDAFKLAKSEGFMVINFRHLFGEQAYKAILQVQDLLKNVAGDPEKAQDSQYSQFSDTLESLKTNPFITDLKSLAFETLAGFLIKSDGWEDVRLNLKVPWSLPEGTSEREVDVSGHKHSWDRIRIIECKAESKDKALDRSYVRKFFTETVPAFIKARCGDHAPSRCEAAIWTTGIVGEHGEKALKEISLKRYIQPQLVGRRELLANLPPALNSTKRLVETIAAVGA
jgi:hypothetical protein